MSKLPNTWKTTKLENLVEYVTSGSRSWSQYYSETGALFVRTQDINKNELCDLEEIARVNLPDRVEGKRTLIQKNDILITITGANVGKSAHVDHDIPEAYVSQSVALVRLVEKSLAKFIHFQLIASSGKNSKTILENSAYGMGRPVLNLSNIRDVEIKLPPRAEQSFIILKLEKLLQQAETLKSRIDLLPALLKQFHHSVIEAGITGRLTEEWRRSTNNFSNDNEDDVEVWPQTRLGDIALDFSYGSSEKSKPEGKIPVLRMGNIQNGKIDWSDLVYSSNEKEIEKYSLQDGDILFNRTNSPELVGKTAIFKNERKAIFAGYLIRVRCSDRLIPDYLNFCLNSPQSKAYCWKVKTDGVSQSNINAKKLAEFRFGLPPVQEQIEIVRKIQNLLALATRLEDRIKHIQSRSSALTQTILAKAFVGELTEEWRDQNTDLAQGQNSVDILLQQISAQRDTLISAGNAHRKKLKDKVVGKMNKAGVLPIINALETSGKWLTGQELLALSGYPNDASTEQLEQFFLDIRKYLIDEIIIRHRPNEAGPDLFELKQPQG